MDKMSGQSLNQKLLEIDNYIHNYKSSSTMSRQFYPCQWKLCHALTGVYPFFKSYFAHLTKSQQSRPQNNLVKGEIWPKFYTHNINILLKYSVALYNFFSALHEVISMPVI